jgi:hypothetical protein
MRGLMNHRELERKSMTRYDDFEKETERAHASQVSQKRETITRKILSDGVPEL